MSRSWKSARGADWDWTEKELEEDAEEVKSEKDPEGDVKELKGEPTFHTGPVFLLFLEPSLAKVM